MSDSKCIEDFDIGVTLGTGSFGRVRFVTHKNTNKNFAIKMLKKTQVIRNQQVNLLNGSLKPLYQ